MGIDIDKFWYGLTPRQAQNIAHGRQKKNFNDFENTVLIHRQLLAMVYNFTREEGKKAVTAQEYWPLSLDKKITPKKSDIPYHTFWTVLTNTIK